MHDIESNKMIASILLAGLAVMMMDTIIDMIYHPESEEYKRGYEIEITEDSDDQDKKEQQEDEFNLAELMKNADPGKGKTIAKKCLMCHNLGKGEPNKIGPHLWDVLGRKKGAIEGFSYSKAIINKGGVWTYEDIYHLISKPQKFIPGTRMAFPGIKKPEDTANLLAYLRTLSDDPLPLPEAEDE